jgi:hypothetical protein
MYLLGWGVGWLTDIYYRISYICSVWETVSHTFCQNCQNCQTVKLSKNCGYGLIIHSYLRPYSGLSETVEQCKKSKLLYLKINIKLFVIGAPLLRFSLTKPLNGPRWKVFRERVVIIHYLWTSTKYISRKQRDNTISLHL